MTPVVIIVLLLMLAAGAVAAVSLTIRSSRRTAGLASAAGARRPALGSPAQVWLSRGERVLSELDATLAESGLWPAVSSDAGSVVAELRITAGQVAELDRALARLPPVDAGRQDPENTPAARLRESRERLLGRMAAAVAGLEQALAELVELVATMSVGGPVADPDPAGELTSRLAGLRAGLIEVRLLSDPEAGSGSAGGGQGHP